MKKEEVIYRLLKPFLKNKGYNEFYGKRLIRVFMDDFFNNKKATLKGKLWAYKKGFLSERIYKFGITEENYKKYMPETEYFKTKSFKNRPFGSWYDNKLTTRFILQPFSDYVEKFYFFVNTDRVVKLMDATELNNEVDVNSIFLFLENKKALAAKKVFGSLGVGFYKLFFDGDKYWANDESFSKSEYLAFLNKLDGYVITKYIQSHKMLQEIFPKAPNAIRVITVFDKEQQKAHITTAFIRIGTKKSGYIEHVIYGAIFCGINIDNGRLFNPNYYEGDEIVSCPIHPDTKVPIEGTLPNWDLITQKVTEISNYLSITPYLTYDIVVTDTGFTILEINSHGDLTTGQFFYPFLANEHNVKLFK